MELWHLFICGLAFQVFSETDSSRVKLVDGGYEDIVIAINPGLPEDVKIIEKIQDMVKEASNYLFTASRKRFFIRSAKILIPITWSSQNYSRRGTESYDKAEVIIANPYLKYGEDPYTLQYGGCGEPGRYIHFTPNFLLNDNLISVYGLRGKVFVHEWAHLRWGVFDEYNDEKPFYVSKERKVEATRCSTDILGTYVKPPGNCQASSCNVKPCLFDSKTGLYEEGCVFVPEKTQTAKESYMYMQALSSVSEFCDENNHNPEAPNLQNRMCDSRSTWDVIKNSKDMNSTPVNVALNVSDPVFSVLQYKDRVLTLVLDVSGSMSGVRIERLYQAAEVFVMQIIEDASYVGIVQFSTAATVTSPLVQIFNDQGRIDLKSKLPKTATGGTNICAGLLSGIEVNKGKDGFSQGSEIVLLSDGEDNFDTSLCFPQIRSSGARLHFIALGPTAVKAIKTIIDETGGLYYVSSDNVDKNGLIDAFSDISYGSGEIAKQAVQLESTAENLKPNKCLSGTVFIDRTIGNETFFLVTWQTGVPSVSLEDPNGKLYTTSQFTNDTTSKSSRLKIPGTALTGPWSYNICNTGSIQVVGIVVNSMATDVTVPPVTVTAHMNIETNFFPNPMVVYASVSQGLLPVKGAKVVATIESVVGASDEFELLDNGAGADIRKNDGIYSRYFTDFKTNGRYSLKVQVVGKKNQSRLAIPPIRAAYLPGYVENGNVVMNTPRPAFNDEDLDIGAFSRTASGGAFEVFNIPADNIGDIYKPGKITDLSAELEGTNIVLTWTATGDDLDKGNATSYDLRMSNSTADLRDRFNTSTSVNISGMTPQPAGSSEKFTFTPQNVVIKNGTILYFAIVAVDKASQVSDLSNIAQVAQILHPTPAPPVVSTTSSATSLKNISSKLMGIALIILINIVFKQFI